MTGSNKPHLLTKEGLARLQAEYQRMVTTGREELAERLHRAFEDGADSDFVDNAELEAARNAQAFLEGRIQEIQTILFNYQLIKESKRKTTTVRVGSWVTVIEEGEVDEERYHVVGAAEADPAEGRISNESPLGVALMGAKVNEVVRVNAPRGILEFRIVKIG